MGNHEYCTECGENDFHLGKPCNPEQRAAHQAWKANIKSRAETKHAGERERLILAVQPVLLQHTLQNPLPYAVMAAMIADEILGTKPSPATSKVETVTPTADHSPLPLAEKLKRVIDEARAQMTPEERDRADEAADGIMEAAIGNAQLTDHSRRAGEPLMAPGHKPDAAGIALARLLYKRCKLVHGSGRDDEIVAETADLIDEFLGNSQASPEPRPAPPPLEENVVWPKENQVLRPIITEGEKP